MVEKESRLNPVDNNSRIKVGGYNLARNGMVQKVILPGRKRAIGFRLADIERLLNSEGGTSKEGQAK